MKKVPKTNKLTTLIKPLKEIERSLGTSYRKALWKPFIKAIREFNLIEENDKIAVAVSGGKDSLLLAKILMELQKYSETPFSLEYLAMDPGFNTINRELLEENAKLLEIPLIIRENNNFNVVSKIATDNPCYMCARMRRGFLYEFAESLGCNKLALGHHFNDVIETTLLNVFYGSQFKTMVPKINSENFTIKLIRPLIYIKEKDIIRFIKSTGLTVMDCGCEVAAKNYGSKRAVIKELVKDLKKDNPQIENSIFRSATNINLNQVYGYQLNNEKVAFNEIFAETLKKDK
ncbi:MAG: ATP-binding protein [Acholeplasmatales bacterium]|jgi:tRNA(Ile)-lysidine synthase TilS/MesJ|nr:hypothetical protein [Acholeplasmataceae bacterium]MCK9234578.1 hypothetical protein [Acholeplasmataceae bacterium]MCK9289881.1 hypothetical protein [Acholeplasmataceae bacterium]MCK9427437.1 hypothetical protein [Acholeplasmataceae bacterium]MDY0115818.1 ATP-binding protein [Acholeplasmatales bacterium]